MNTFIPIRDFIESAKCLDNKRLGKQRVEVLQILKALHGETKGWVNHPCTKMWRNDINALVYYGLIICSEWKMRGYKDTCSEKIEKYKISEGYCQPQWITEEFCAAHRSNLLRKNKEYYSRFGWTESDDLPYIWPIMELKNIKPIKCLNT